jgi:hypothetical protein
MATGFTSSSTGNNVSGRLFATGNNDAGQLGLGDNVDRNAFTAVGTDSDWVQVTTGEGIGLNSGFTIARKSNGTLWATGYNGNGELGIGSTISKNLFTQIGTDTDWATVCAGYQAAIAVKTNGTLWAWGSNALYKLGLPTTGTYTSPTQIGSDTDWLKVWTYSNRSFAIKTDGTLWSVGRNEFGDFGDGTYTNKTTWSKIGTATDWKNIKSSFGGTFAQKTNGYLYAAGWNIQGRLGIGENVPVLCNVTSSSSVTNEFTCDSTANLAIYNPPSSIYGSYIAFGGTTFGGVTGNETQYIVKAITSNTTFTVSTTAGGNTLALTTATGNMTVKPIYLNTFTAVTPNYDWQEYNVNQNGVWALDPSYTQYGTTSTDVYDIPAAGSIAGYGMRNANTVNTARSILLGRNGQSVQIRTDKRAYVYGLNTQGCLDNGVPVYTSGPLSFTTPTVVSGFNNVTRLQDQSNDFTTFLIL